MTAGEAGVMERMAFETEATRERVAAWSDFRLPFEPKGEVRRFRDELRSALSGLARRPTLHAEYVSLDARRCDVENVALYNVGAAPFRGLGTESIIVERSYGPVPPPPSGAPRSHFLGYRALPTPAGWSAWRVRQKLIEWKACPVVGPPTPSSIWASLKAGPAEFVHAWDGTTPLGIEVRVASHAPMTLVSDVKKLVDGIVAAAHVHNGTDLGEVASRLSMTLAASPEATAAWLMDAQAAVLGPRRVVHIRARGIQWNPADDALVAVTVERAQQAEPGMSVSAAIYVVDAQGVPDARAERRFV